SDPESRSASRRLTLQGGGGASPGDGRPAVPRRPGGTIEAGGVEFRARQQLWWRLDAEAMELVAQIDYEVRQGQLFQLPVRLPAGWELEAVEVSPAEWMRSRGVRPDKGAQLLLVDLRR